MSFLFLTLTESVLLIVLSIVIAVSAFTINILNNRIHNFQKILDLRADIDIMKRKNYNCEINTKILIDENNELLHKIQETEKEIEKEVLLEREELKSKALAQVVSPDFPNENIGNNQSLFFCVCLKGDKAAVAFMLESYSNELKNYYDLIEAKSLVEKSQTTLNKEEILELLRKEILLITNPSD